MRLASRAMAQHYREIADRYARETGETHCAVVDVVRWAMKRELLQITPGQLEDLYTKYMSAALREDQTTDEHGNSVRLRHCAAVECNGDGVRTLWAHLDDATDEHLLLALRQRRRAIKADINALRADLNFINARREMRGLRSFQMDLCDFSDEDETGD